MIDIILKIKYHQVLMVFIPTHVIGWRFRVNISDSSYS